MDDLLTVYFASNRNNKGSDEAPDFGNDFNPERPQFFRVGSARVQRFGDDEYRFQDAMVEPENLEMNELGSRRLFEQLRRAILDEKRDIILFIHGFASTFSESLERAAQLHWEYEISRPLRKADELPPTSHRPVVFVFSWPSNGRVFPAAEYFRDREDARNSGVAMARALERLLEFLQRINAEHQEVLRQVRAQEIPMPLQMPRCEQSIHLVAHSMGNWALRHAVVALADRTQLRPLPRVFEHAFLMAADEDDDTVENDLKLALLPGLAKFVHVYHSRDDQALEVSDRTKGNPNRLGEDGPRNMETISNRVYAIDCSSVDETDFSHGRHQYYRLRSEVINDVRQVLSGKPFDKIDGREQVKRVRSFRIQSMRER